MRILIVGDGAVARLHGEGLADEDHAHEVRFWTPERASLPFESAILGSDAVIVASPTPFHFEQAREALGAGKPVLVEMPPVASIEEARSLEALAESRGIALGACHTSRFLAPYQAVADVLAKGEFGEVREVTYTRHLAPRRRLWQEPAIRHHAVHALDLMLWWFGDLCVSGASGTWHGGLVQAKLPNGASVSISVLYDVRHPKAEMHIACDSGVIATDGFSWLRCGTSHWDWETSDTYPAAIAAQDNAFLALNSSFVPWGETTTLVRLLDQSESLMNC